nr:hypothetical protein [Polyangiaceae bacterium]
ARIEQIADRFLEATPHQVLELGALLLGRAGLPAEQLLGGLHAPVEAPLSALARHISVLSTRLHRAPTGVDLVAALGGTERQLSAMAARYFRRYHATVSGWRDYLFWLRVELGVVALRSGQRPSEVSRWLGFRSPSALCHAFKDAGLASPGSWRPGHEPEVPRVP